MKEQLGGIKISLWSSAWVVAYWCPGNQSGCLADQYGWNPDRIILRAAVCGLQPDGPVPANVR